jgi:hypothetical protein
MSEKAKPASQKELKKQLNIKAIKSILDACSES